MIRHIFDVDWIMLFAVLILAFFGLITIKSFSDAATPDYLYWRQLTWIAVGLAVFFLASLIDWSFLKTNSIFLIILYLCILALLIFLIVSGEPIRGASSWLMVYSISVEPVELLKPVLVLLLAKYFSKRHIEIARFSHLFVSGVYAGIPAVLVLLQPDLGSAFILGAIWLGMALVSGIQKKHLMWLFLVLIVLASISWEIFLLPYQKARILAFLDPASVKSGAGYQSLQSTIAIGSGRIFGKGIGFGTQSRLEFLPEHTTDFIFAAFAEEWGILGVSILFTFFGILLSRILKAGIYGESNFEKLYSCGLALLIFLQASVHVGMNSGIFPITGLGMPFLSYGGSSLASLFFALGILQSFSLHRRGIFMGTEERFKEGIVGA